MVLHGALGDLASFEQGQAGLHPKYPFQALHSQGRGGWPAPCQGVEGPCQGVEGP